MKKISLISGLLIVIMLIMFLTGIIDFNNSTNKSINKGNQLYTSRNYEKALQIYKEGLVENPEDPVLNYNAGQAAYFMGDYKQAITYYNKSSDKLDEYLNFGNSNFKMQQYQPAMDIYREGILKFPQNIDLKYNYEFAKKKIEEQNKNNEDKQDKQDENQDKQDQKNKDQKDKEEDQQDKNEDKQDEKKDQENQGNEQENQDKEKQNQDNEKKKQDKQDQKNKEGNQEQNNQQDENLQQNDKEIMQVLEMLEKQEEDSLKNNHEVKNQGKEEKYDW